MNNDIKRLLLWLLAGIIIIGSVLLIIFSGNPGPATDDGLSAITLTRPVTPDEWIKGNKSGFVTIVEYSDFQCPGCAAWYAGLKAIVKEFGSDLRFVYRHYPLSQHKNSTIAAKAAESAGLQEKFWEMHDLLFENQQKWAELDTDEAEELFKSYAEKIGLDLDKYSEDFDSDKVEDAINDDLSSAISAKIPGTPGLFLNGIFIKPKDDQELRKILLEKLTK